MGKKSFVLRRVAAVWTALLLALVVNNAALAHPLGNFTINHYSRLEIAPRAIKVLFILDYAEIPTFQERQIIDANNDGEISAKEQNQYLARKIQELQTHLVLLVNGSPQSLTPVPNSAELQFLPGQGNLPTTRLSAWFSAPLSFTNGQPVTIVYRDENFAERIGWREIVVQAASLLALQKSDVPLQDVSNELRSYPQDLLAQPLNAREANITLVLGSAGQNLAPPSTRITTNAFGAFNRAGDPFAALITTPELTLPVILVLMGSAILLGALHAFSPGHGKTIVGAYLVGSRGTAKHALLLGLVVTATHTVGVYGLGLVTLFASQYILPEQLYPWLGVISGALVALIGGRLFLTRFAAARAHQAANRHAHAEGRTHSHTHESIHAHRHLSTPMFAHAPSMPGALSEHHTHSHGNMLMPHAHAEHHDNAVDEIEHARSHIPAVLVGAPLTWRNLVSLGISGGLLPCPSALVVMLSAIALGRVALGLALIVAFSLGLAGVLILSGLMLLYAGKVALRFLPQGRASSLLFRLVPIGSALLVTLLGIGIAVEAFVQTGLVR